MEYYSAIKMNEIGSFVVMWMDLETITHSEVSQKEKNINACMWNLEKHYRWYYLQSSRDTDVENKCMDSKGGKNREGEIGRLGLTYIHY